MGFIKRHGWFVNDHSLFESQVVNVGYVVGKHPDWTYRHGLEEQIQDHFRAHDNGEDEDALSITIVYSRIVMETAKIPILAIQCGIHHRDRIETILNRNLLHPTIDIISAQLRRANPSAYATALNDHMNCKDNVTAVVIKAVPMDFAQSLKAVLIGQKSSSDGPLILDLEPSRGTIEEGKYYATVYRDLITESVEWLQKAIGVFNEEHGLTITYTEPDGTTRPPKKPVTATYVSRHAFTKKWDGIQSYATIAARQVRPSPLPMPPARASIAVTPSNGSNAPTENTDILR